MYSDAETAQILNSIVNIIKDKEITTRTNRRLLKNLLSSKLSFELKEYSSSASRTYNSKSEYIPVDSLDKQKSLNSNHSSGQEESSDDKEVPENNNPNNGGNSDNNSDSRVSSIRSRISNEQKLIFGGKLSLKKGSVNNLYRAIEDFYNSIDENDKNVAKLCIVGMSLRLFLEVAARQYYKELEKNSQKSNNDDKGDKKKSDKDSLYIDYISKNKRLIDKSLLNFATLSETELHKRYSEFTALLGKYAHGNIAVDKENIINCSKFVAAIIKIDFEKK